MVHVYDASRCVAVLADEEVKGLNSDFLRALKAYLAPLLGASRFRQRLLVDDREVQDGESWEELGCPSQLQVLVLPYRSEAPKDLMDAVKQGDESEVTAALENLLDPNLEMLISDHDFQCFTPLYCAALQGRLDLIQLLLEGGAHVDQGGFSTPLAVAAQKGHLHVVQYLVEQNANVEKVNDYGMTPLRAAEITGQTSVMQYLLKVRCEQELNRILSPGIVELEDTVFG
mmetsp:Transcript_26575/g.63381  ORF Transcript_26575/g.63381 Transcript_26575/m.63381 type:complete len:229 (-) Transcript_26575:141-827(-)|eukprot:CAMPEP_0181434954 /NCGR_PEP_ID=MMETSP1110-20121109/20083_1 /TAXON_ID=174948 /ORGANISM="Symbiodinium sp., Strain CCMP421" /LENGTH=228 /DNA_ID=CAMNT_0023558473 /DNA_START=27 /DNA_END=713 /DNA_ORIENTATION=-